MALEVRRQAQNPPLIYRIGLGRLVRIDFGGPEPTQENIHKLIAHLELSLDTYPKEEAGESTGGPPRG